MPRKPNPERVAEYEALCKFALVVSEFMEELSTEVPSKRIAYAALLRDALVKSADRPLSQRLTGIRMAVHDDLEWTRGLEPDEVKALDARLTAQGCETLTSARSRVWQTIPKILKRGRIRNEEEFYLLIEQLNDVDSDTVLNGDAERLSGERPLHSLTLGRRGSAHPRSDALKGFFDAWISWFEKHPVAKWLAGAALFLSLGFAFIDEESRSESFGLLLFGCACLGMAVGHVQVAYLRRTLSRDWRDGLLEELDPAVTIEWVDPDTFVGGLRFANGRDLRETLIGGEALWAFAVSLGIGAIGVASAWAFGVSAVAFSASLAESENPWSRVAAVGGMLGATGATLAFVAFPLIALRHWLKSRRLIARRDSESLRVLAEAARRASGGA
jgi:hypothetical protein